MKSALLLLVVGILLSFNSMAQIAGCTDPQAFNFNDSASINDGSCYYTETSTEPVTLSRPLPKTIHETSGLIFWKDGFWTHNDSGGEPEIYKLDTLKWKIIQTVRIENARNVDWEEIAQDETHIFIGDFGNNLGSRKDLTIYKINKSDLPEKADGSVQAEIIRFSYADQSGFEVANRKNNYDCEAMLAMGDSLYLFSKNWVDLQTRLYALPKIAGEYTARPQASCNVDGLVTGADVSPSGNEIVLVGYRNYNPFVYLLFDFGAGNFFSGNKRRIAFSGMTGVQTEGVAWLREHEAVISAEKTKVANARMYKLFTSLWTIRQTH